MKPKTLVLLMFVTILLTACGGSASADHDQNLIYAQQTLDALNAGVSQDQQASTAAPQTNNDAGSAPTATSAPQNNNDANSAQSEPTGTRLNLFDAVDGVIDFPAGQAFYIAHGWSFDTSNPAENVINTSSFVIELDGQTLTADTVFAEPGDSGSISWVYNFPEGLSGSHTVVALWYAPCEIVQDASSCNDPAATVEADRMEVTINFTP